MRQAARTGQALQLIDLVCRQLLEPLQTGYCRDGERVLQEQAGFVSGCASASMSSEADVA
jgi:hypothetical protein